jgi:dTDP-glucose 4,6-dehydratase
MNLLVTGGCGFIGSNFINYFFEKYQVSQIINIDAMYYCASVDNIKEEIRNSNRYTFIEGNINNYDLVCGALNDHKITHIIHFAAQSHVDNSFNESLQYTYDNVKGTHTLLEAIKNTNINIILLHVSTDEVYGESDFTDEQKTEESILCPTNPYSASKAAAEMYVRSYIYSFGLKAIITRGNNVYGMNQYPEKLIPKFILALLNDKKCPIHGKGETIRNFIHVSDVCTAIDKIIKLGTFGEVYNIGGDHNNEKSVLDVTYTLINKIFDMENYSKYIEYVDDRPFNDKRYFISNNKLKELNWEQKTSFDQGINTLITEYKKLYSTGFILYRNVVDQETNKLWNNIYTKIRQNCDWEIIIICNSNEKYVQTCNPDNKLINCRIIKSDFNNNNILIPYHYFYYQHFFNKAIIINDKLEPNLINDIINKAKETDFYIIQEKEHNIDNNIHEQNILKKLDKATYLDTLHNNKTLWHGSKDMTLILTYDKLKLIQSKYDILKYITNNTDSYKDILENVFCFLLWRTSELES